MLGCQCRQCSPSSYTVDCGDFKVELARGLSAAWEMARSEVGKAQRRQYDKTAKLVDYQMGTG